MLDKMDDTHNCYLMRWSPAGHATIIADGTAKNFFYLTLFMRMLDLNDLTWYDFYERKGRTM